MSEDKKETTTVAPSGFGSKIPANSAGGFGASSSTSWGTTTTSTAGWGSSKTETTTKEGEVKKDNNNNNNGFGSSSTWSSAKKEGQQEQGDDKTSATPSAWTAGTGAAGSSSSTWPKKEESDADKKPAGVWATSNTAGTASWGTAKKDETEAKSSGWAASNVTAPLATSSSFFGGNSRKNEDDEEANPKDDKKKEMTPIKFDTPSTNVFAKETNTFASSNTFSKSTASNWGTSAASTAADITDKKESWASKPVTSSTNAFAIATTKTTEKLPSDAFTSAPNKTADDKENTTTTTTTTTSSRPATFGGGNNTNNNSSNNNAFANATAPPLSTGDSVNSLMSWKSKSANAMLEATTAPSTTEKPTTVAFQEQPKSIVGSATTTTASSGFGNSAAGSWATNTTSATTTTAGKWDSSTTTNTFKSAAATTSTTTNSFDGGFKTPNPVSSNTFATTATTATANTGFVATSKDNFYSTPAAPNSNSALSTGFNNNSNSTGNNNNNNNNNSFLAPTTTKSQHQQQSSTSSMPIIRNPTTGSSTHLLRANSQTGIGFARNIKQIGDTIRRVDHCIAKDSLLRQLNEMLDRLEKRINKANDTRSKLEEELNSLMTKFPAPQREWYDGSGNRTIPNSVNETIAKLWYADANDLLRNGLLATRSSNISETSGISSSLSSLAKPAIIGGGGKTVGQTITADLQALSTELLDLMPKLEEHMKQMLL